MTSVLVRARRAAVPMFATLFLLSACSGEEGPTYPASFDPAGLRADLTVASALYSAPATESFGAAGFMIDFARSADSVAVVSCSSRRRCC